MEIARRVGVHATSVRRQRMRRGIPAYVKPRVAPNVSTRDPADQVDWYIQPLGEMPDRELARILGVSNTIVSYQRRKRKIRVYEAKRQQYFFRRRVTVEPEVVHLLEEHGLTDLGKHGFSRLANAALRVALDERLPKQLRDQINAVLENMQ